MKFRFSLLLVLIAACLGLGGTAIAQTVEYLLVPVNVTLTPTEVGIVTATTGYAFNTTSCANMLDTSGRIVPDPNFTGTAYQTNLRLMQTGGNPVANTSVYVMNQALPKGTRLTGFTLLENGAQCTETINGTNQVFAKYQAVTCTNCGQPAHPHHQVSSVSPFRKHH